MKSMKIVVLASAVAFAASTVPSFAAEAIVGNWKRSNGTIIKYSGGGSMKLSGCVLGGMICKSETLVRQ